MAHPFICPNCGHRYSELDRNLGFTRQPKGCTKCGFAFLFELLDDYFPAPDAAFFVCDGEGRIVGCGRNSFEFTGVEEEEVIGQRVRRLGEPAHHVLSQAAVIGRDFDLGVLAAVCERSEDELLDVL